MDKFLRKASPMSSIPDENLSQEEAPESVEVSQEPAPAAEPDDPETPEQLELSEELIAKSGHRLERILEALLFMALDPLPLSQIRSAIKAEFPLSKKAIEQILETLKQTYVREERSFELVQVAGGYQLRTKAEFSPWIRKIMKGQSAERLSKAALETLAVIAYKQPVTRAEIEEIRGVNVDAIMKVLLDKSFIHASGKKDIPGKPWQYSTTKNFLLHFGLKTLQELPSTGASNLN